MTPPATEKPRCYCGRPAVNGYLCTDDANKLNVDLARLAWMMPELTTLLTRQVNTHGGAAPRRPMTTTVEPESTTTRALSKSERAVALVPHPIPFDEAASAMLAEARATLVEVCRTLGTDFAPLIGAR